MGKNFIALAVVFIVFIAMIWVWVSNMKNEPQHMPGTVEMTVPPTVASPGETKSEVEKATTPTAAPVPTPADAPKQP